MFGKHVKQILELFPGLIQRHLHQRGLWTFDLVEFGEQLVERFRALIERFAGHRVRAGDVHFDHGGATGRAAHRNAVILDAFVQIAGLIVIRTRDRHGNLHVARLRPSLFRARNNDFRTLIGKTDMHHHRIIFGQTVEPRLRIAGARTRRGGSDRFEAEAGVVEQHRHLAVLVEAGGKAERIDEVDAHHAGFQHGVGIVEHFTARPHQRRNVLGDLAELDHLVVRHIGRLIEHEMRLDDVLVAEGEEICGGFVHRIVPEILRNIRHGSLFSHRLSQESNTSIDFADGMSTFVFVRFERL